MVVHAPAALEEASQEQQQLPSRSESRSMSLWSVAVSLPCFYKLFVVCGAALPAAAVASGIIVAAHTKQYLIIGALLVLLVVVTLVPFVVLLRIWGLYGSQKEESQPDELAPMQILFPAFRCWVPADESADVCCICLEARQDGQLLRQLVCGHDFHVGCIDSWVQSTRSAWTGIRVRCPMCRREQPRVETSSVILV